jgi:hypothetical protein
VSAAIAPPRVRWQSPDRLEWPQWGRCRQVFAVRTRRRREIDVLPKLENRFARGRLSPRSRPHFFEIEKSPFLLGFPQPKDTFRDVS